MLKSFLEDPLRPDAKMQDTSGYEGKRLVPQSAICTSRKPLRSGCEPVRKGGNYIIGTHRLSIAQCYPPFTSTVSMVNTPCSAHSSTMLDISRVRLSADRRGGMERDACPFRLSVSWIDSRLLNQ
jgi:hypothetical protein